MRGFAALFIWWKSDGILEYKQKTKTHCWLNSVYGCSLSICVRKAHSAQPLMGSATPERFQLRTSVRPSSANSGIATNCRRQALPMSVCTIRSRLSQLTVINHPFMLLGLRSGQLSACMMSLAQPLPLYSRFHCARCAYVRHVRVGTAPAFALPSCNCFSVVLCTQRFWGVLLLIVTFCMQVEYLLLPSNWIIVLLAQLHFVCSFFPFARCEYTLLWQCYCGVISARFRWWENNISHRNCCSCICASGHCSMVNQFEMECVSVRLNWIVIFVNSQDKSELTIQCLW